MQTIRSVDACAEMMVKFLTVANALDVTEKKMMSPAITPSGNHQLRFSSNLKDGESFDTLRDDLVPSMLIGRVAGR